VPASTHSARHSAKLKVSSAVIDIEVVYVAEDGSMSFHGLRMPCRPKSSNLCAITPSIRRI
jgi:hypothetical protein